jgi:predicted nucleic acid-binding protein
MINTSTVERIKALFCDTSFFYAALDKRDREHSRAKTLAQAIQEKQIPLVTTWEVVVETATLLRYRYSYRGATVFLDRVLPRLNIFYIDSEVRAKALLVFRKFSRDKEISLCDAISYVVVSERLNFIPCLAFDEDFKRLGLTVLEEIP